MDENDNKEVKENVPTGADAEKGKKGNKEQEDNSKSPKELSSAKNELKKEMDEHSKKIEELTSLLQRTQAEFENFKKRIEKEANLRILMASEDIIKKLLPIIDNFELALGNTENHEEFVKGMQLIFSQMIKTLEDEGLKKIDALDKKFDPYLHEALLTEDCKGADEDIVLQELQKGYMLHDKILRHAKVKICRRK